MRLLLVLCGFAWSGCTCTLPESVPMKVSLSMLPTANRPPLSRHETMEQRFIGAEVVSDGKVLTTIELSNNVLLVGPYTATRAEAVVSQKAHYALRVKGLCGAHELPLTGPPSSWQAMDEKALAGVLERGHDVPLFFDVASGDSVVVFVDAGDAPAGKVTINDTELTPTKPGFAVGVDLWLSGCPLPLEVKVDGEVVGQITGNEPAVLISTKPELCHEMGAVLYGDQSQPPFDRFVTRGRGVFSLPMSPDHFLEFAPSSVKTSGKGATVTQLVRVGCR